MRIKHLILLLFFLPLGSMAQTIELGAFAGGSYYLGDLNPGKHFLDLHPAFGGLLRYNLGTRWAFRFNAYFGKVSANDSVSRTSEVRGLKFESNITDLALTAEFNFLDYFTGTRKNVISTYIFGGIGFLMFNPKTDGVNLKDIGTEGQNIGFEGRSPYNLFSVTMPFGVGVKYSISRRLALAFEWGMRKTWSDYIDDVSTTYYLDAETIDPANSNEYLSDPTLAHKPYMQRGNPKYNDWTNFTGLSITYKIDPFLSRRCHDQQRSGLR